MLLQALVASLLIALISLIGVFFFGQDKRLVGLERFVIPVAVGVFLSLVLFELIPETVSAAPEFGGIVVAIGFLAFYILASVLHKKHHHLAADDCDNKGAATLLLIGDGIHNLADGFILGGAFLIDPTIGVATAIGLALHELPQEIVEFGVLIRAGYTRKEAALRNALSASSIVAGTIFVLLIAEHAEEYVWILTGFAAGNLLFLAASDLLPRIHGGLREYGSVWRSTLAIIIGFVVMTTAIYFVHERFGHGHEHTESSKGSSPDDLADSHEHTHDDSHPH